MKQPVCITAALAFVCLAAPLSAQGGRTGFPNVNKVIMVADGDSVRVYNRFVFDATTSFQPRGRRLDIQYATSIPATDTTSRRQQAERIAAFFGPEALQLGARMMSIEICETRGCAETREPPSAWFEYERRDNAWRPLPRARRGR